MMADMPREKVDALFELLADLKSSVSRALTG